MATRVRVDREQCRREIRAAVGRSEEPKLRTREIAEEVRNWWRDVEAPKPGPDHPYSRGGPGSYMDSIQVKRSRNVRGQFEEGWTVFSDHPNANFIEFGTGPDKPGSRSPWGPFTPTPAFHCAGRTALHFGGTAP